MDENSVAGQLAANLSPAAMRGFFYRHATGRLAGASAISP